MNEWISLAFSPPVRQRAIKVALLVGVILAVINYGDKIINGSFELRDLTKMFLSFLVPYCVSTYSAVSAMRAQAKS